MYEGYRANAKIFKKGRFSILLSKHIENALLFQNQVEVKDIDVTYREELEDTAIIPKSLLICIIAETRRKSVDKSAPLTTLTTQCRLPSVAPPTFNGKHSEFKNVILFETFVDKDDTLHDIEKFNRLMSCLAGDALSSLRWVYESACLIFIDNILTLFNLPEISHSSPQYIDPF